MCDAEGTSLLHLLQSSRILEGVTAAAADDAARNFYIVDSLHALLTLTLSILRVYVYVFGFYYLLVAIPVQLAFPMQIFD